MRASPDLNTVLGNRGVEKQAKSLSLKRHKSSTTGRKKDDHDALHGYKFQKHSCFGPKSGNSEIYEEIAKPIVEGAMKGINGTVFAYGQTSSGKTHTVMGGSTDPGLIVLSTIDVFRTIAETPSSEFLLRISICEIYNEVIKDLLAPTDVKAKRLQVRSHKTRGIIISGLTEEIVTSVDHVLRLIEVGIANRAVGETKMNKGSSRSHTIFRMTIESKPADDADLDEIEPTLVDDGYATTKSKKKKKNSKKCVRVSTLNIVDLAGSERTNEAGTGGSGKRFKEGVNINKSLLTLGQVIERLAQRAALEAIDEDPTKVHVPFRNSKLTRILEPSLGGNARTAVVCTVSPLIDHAEQSMGTLRFAKRAVCVRNRAKVNKVDMSKAMMGQHQEKISELRSQLEKCNLMKSSGVKIKEEQGLDSIREIDETSTTQQNEMVISLENDKKELKLREEENEKLRLGLKAKADALETEKNAVEQQRKELEEQLTKLTALVLNSSTISTDRKGKSKSRRAAHRLSIGTADRESGAIFEAEVKRVRRETWCPGFWGKELSLQGNMLTLMEEEEEDSSDETDNSGEGTKESMDFRSIQVDKLRHQVSELKEDLSVQTSRCATLEQMVAQLQLRVNRAEGVSYEAFEGLNNNELDELQNFHLCALARIAEARLISAYKQKFIEKQTALNNKLEETTERMLNAEQLADIRKEELETQARTLEDWKSRALESERRISMESRRHRQESLQMEISIRNFHASKNKTVDSSDLTLNMENTIGESSGKSSGNNSGIKAPSLTKAKSSPMVKAKASPLIKSKKQSMTTQPSRLRTPGRRTPKVRGTPRSRIKAGEKAKITSGAAAQKKVESEKENKPVGPSSALKRLFDEVTSPQR